MNILTSIVVPFFFFFSEKIFINATNLRFSKSIVVESRQIHLSDTILNEEAHENKNKY